MHELSKTGRWLGGNTPTGYESESVSHVTIDGKTKRACKLKILPEEIGIVKLIYDKFLETGSLTKTETYLLQNGYTTKNGANSFTRFAVKGILSNPVYLIADEFAYDYLTKSHVDLFAEQSDFDGVHGIMAYNRTLQQPGRAHQIKPMEEWIVSVGKHQGVIEGKAWVKVQTILERNKSKKLPQAPQQCGLALRPACLRQLRRVHAPQNVPAAEHKRARRSIPTSAL